MWRLGRVIGFPSSPVVERKHSGSLDYLPLSVNRMEVVEAVESLSPVV